MKRCLIVLVFTLAMVAGFASSLRADCSPHLGNGYDVKCLNGSPCGSSCGSDYRWCIRETCGIGHGCRIDVSDTTACIVGGCMNFFFSNCNCT